MKTFLTDSMKTWKTELTSAGERLGVIHIRRGIFQGDSLSPLLFVSCMIPLTLILRISTAGYDLAKELKVPGGVLDPCLGIGVPPRV